MFNRDCRPDKLFFKVYGGLNWFWNSQMPGYLVATSGQSNLKGGVTNVQHCQKVDNSLDALFG